MTYTQMSNILLSILIERPRATARRKAGREREQESEGYVAYGFVFILFGFDSLRVSYHSHLDTFHSLGHCFSFFLAHILPVLLFFFCSDWCKAVSRRQGARRGLISCQYCPPCSVTRPKVLMLCINKALKRPGPPLYWAVQILQESSCPIELAVKVLQKSIVEYSSTKTGNTRKQTYR